MRPLALSLLLVPCLALLLGCGGGGAPERANIVLVSIDSLRADHLSAYGYPHSTSPTIDRLAAQGARFDNAFSTTSWTLPAHAALFTGLNDSTHGLVDNGLRLGDEHVTLAEVLADAGYQTAGFFGGPYLHPTFGLAQGFETYESCMSDAGNASAGEHSVREAARAAQGASHSDITGPRTLAAVRRWFEHDRDEDRPFFLFIHLWDVHYDYSAPQRYVDIFSAGYDGPVTGRAIMRDPRIRSDMPERDRTHLIALYDAEIRFTDDILGQILDTVDGHSRRGETLVAVTADHGEEFFEHGGKGHQRTLFDEVLRVPLVLHWPGVIAPGLGIDTQVRLTDVAPTLLSLASVSLPVDVQGRDVSGLLRGEALAPAPALGELLVDGRQLRSLRTAAGKLVLAGSARGGARAVYFDLDADPRELRPVRPGSPGIAPARAALQRALDDGAALRASRGAPAEAAAVDSEMADRLRELGYLDTKELDTTREPDAVEPDTEERGDGSGGG